MANEMNPGEGISLRDLQTAHKEGTIERTVIDAIHNHDQLLSDVKWYAASHDDRDEADLMTGKPKAHHKMMGEGMVPSGASFQTKSVSGANAYAMLDILEDQYKVQQRRGTLDHWLNRQVKAQIASLAELQMMDILYGDRKADPKGINGIASFYNKIGSIYGSDLLYSTRTVDAGVSSTATDLRSIFVITFGEDKIKPFYPKGAENIGLNFGDKMERVQMTDPKNGGVVWHLQRTFQWDGGIHIVDPRCAGRLCNIPLAELNTTDGAFKNKFLPALRRLTDAVKRDTENKPAMYMDPKLATEIKIGLDALTMANAFEEKQVANEYKLKLFDVEVRLNESQGLNETRVTA